MLWHKVNSAAEIFQKKVSEMLDDIKGMFNISDDILVSGRTEGEHEAALHATLQR